MTKDLKLKNNGVKRSRLFVLRHSKSPSCLIEPLFMTNPKEYSLVKKDKFRDKMAQSMFQGIKNYFTEFK